MTPEAATLLLLAGERVVRADFAPGAVSPGSIQSAPRPRGISVADAVRAGLALGGKPRRDVWVLSGEFWTQSVELNRSQVAGLSDEQIARALSFEIEPFSGIPVSESALGFDRIGESGGTEAFWIVEMTAADRDAVQRAVAEAGGRLAGIGHPGGLPRALSGAGGAWQRLEAWESGLIWVTNDGARGVQARAVNVLPARAALPASGAFESLSLNGRSPVPDSAADLPWQRFTLQEDAALRLWCEQWRAARAGKIGPMPIVAPAPAPPSPRRHVIAAAALELAIVLICAGHALIAGHEKAALERQRAAFAAVARSQEDAAKQSAELRKQIASLEAEVKQREQVAARLDSVPALLRALASSRPEDIVVRGIQSENASSMVISGVSLDAAVVDEMSLLLNAALRPAGWTVQPLQKTGRHKLVNGGPWEFSIRVTHDSAVAPPRAGTKGGAR